MCKWLFARLDMSDPRVIMGSIPIAVAGVIPCSAQCGTDGAAAAAGWTGGRPNLATRLGSPNTTIRAMPAAVRVSTAAPKA